MFSQNAGGTLPLNASRLRSLVVFGDNDTVSCEGSGHVRAPYIVTPYAGIAAYLAAHAPGVRLTYDGGENATRAAALAAAADAAIVVVATTSSEGSDRKNLSLPLWQDALVTAVSAVQPATVAVTRCPGACVMPWAPATAAIVYQLMAGQVCRVLQRSSSHLQIPRPYCRRPATRSQASSSAPSIPRASSRSPSPTR